MPLKKDIIGLKFGRLIVKGDGPRKKSRRSVICSCSCGNEIVTDPRSLMSGSTMSCGCFQKEIVAKISISRTLHGKCATSEYNTWVKIKDRCLNPLNNKYPYYGGRGIKVCDEWLSDFKRFASDMGLKPDNKSSIDRIDVNGNYEPKNCRWATPIEQSRNKRNHRLVIVGGRSMPLSAACELLGINYRSALYRLNNGGNWANILPPPPTGGES